MRKRERDCAVGENNNTTNEANTNLANAVILHRAAVLVLAVPAVVQVLGKHLIERQ